MGSRLKPLTNTIPKCLVKLDGTSIIERLTTNLTSVGLTEHLVIGGYKADKLKKAGFDIIINPYYKETNMVWSLLCAIDKLKQSKSEFFNIFYGDIVVSKANIEKLLECSNDFSIIADLKWEELWSLRMDDYFSDVESFKFDGDSIIELGKVAKSKEDIQAQYVGAIRVKRLILINLLEEYKGKASKLVDLNLIRSSKNLYMTDFIQNYINTGGNVKPVLIEGGWLEVDSVSDLLAYESISGKSIIDSVS